MAQSDQTILTSLTKENFWDEMTEKFPEAMQEAQERQNLLKSLADLNTKIKNL